MTSRIAYLCHNDSFDIYESNQPDDFIVDFDEHMEFNSLSTIELIEFKCKLAQKTNENVYIFSDLCCNSILNGTKKPILRSIKLPGAKHVAVSFSSPIPLATPTGVMKSCRIYIRDKNFTKLSFQFLEAEVTLRFKNVSNSKI